MRGACARAGLGDSGASRDPGHHEPIRDFALGLSAQSNDQHVRSDDHSQKFVDRVLGASNLPIAVQTFSGKTCSAGSLVGATAVGSPVAVTTDAAGYFGVSVAGISPGTFVAIGVTSPTVTPMSACLVSSRDND